MNSVSPVFTEREIEVEQVIALEQKQYSPVITARVFFDDGTLSSAIRFRFTEKERAAIAAGADLIVSQPHHTCLMPIRLQFAMPDNYPIIES